MTHTASPTLSPRIQHDNNGIETESQTVCLRFAAAALPLAAAIAGGAGVLVQLWRPAHDM